MKKLAVLACIVVLSIGSAGDSLANPARLGGDLKLTIPAGDFNGGCGRAVFDFFQNPLDGENAYWKLDPAESGASEDCGPQSTDIRSNDLGVDIPFLEFGGTFYSVGLVYDPAVQDASGLVWRLASAAGSDAPFHVTVAPFDYGEFIPSRFSWDGANISPALAWDRIPDGTRSFVLIMDDPDAPGGVWTHWVVYDIPPDVVQLAENAGTQWGLPTGAKHGVNTSGSSSYDGPGPPPGPAHRYFFRLYALSVSNLNPAGASIDDVRAAMDGNIIAVTEFMGLYASE